MPHLNTTGIRLWVRGAGSPWSDEEVASFFAPFGPSVAPAAPAAPASTTAAAPAAAGFELLDSYRVAQDHGGDLITHKAPPRGPGFELRLPLDPAAVRPVAKLAG